jgi:hypothetical protein
MCCFAAETYAAISKFESLIEFQIAPIFYTLPIAQGDASFFALEVSA